jgi:uncharacterized protein YfbU (UPF0304 family)
MATVTIRLDDNTRDDLEEIARTRGTTISELLRARVNELLGRGVEMPDDIPHTLSSQDRLVLAQQHEILAMLRPDDDESRHHQEMAKVLREGYTGEYGAVFAGIYPEMPRSECKLVWDILDMFRVVGASVSRLSAEDRSTLGPDAERRLRFGGFDLNDSREGKMLIYVRYLVDRERWEELKPRLAEIGDDGNSHSRRRETYERMLAEFTPVFEEAVRDMRGHPGDLLTVDDLKRVAEAWAHPNAGGSNLRPSRRW